MSFVKIEPIVEFIPGSRPERTLGGGLRFQGAPRCRWTHPDRLLTGEQFHQLQNLVGDNHSAAVFIRIPTQDLHLSTYRPNIVSYQAILHWPEEEGVQRVQYNQWQIDELLFTNLVEPLG